MFLIIFYTLFAGRKDSLPGLGDGKDPDIIETDKPSEIITEADRARIARYHSYNTSALVGRGEGNTRFLLRDHFYIT